MVRAVVVWTLVALATWFVVSLGAGLVYGFYRRPSGGSLLIYALGGSYVPALFFLRFIHLIASALLAACALWSVMAKAVPFLEASQFSLVGFLVAYALIIGLLLWLVFSINREIAVPALGLYVASLVAPRLLVSSLASGAFAD